MRSPVGSPRPLPLRPLPLHELTATWEDAPVVVSVLCPTLNHEHFIRDALNGVLAQRTRFRFEVIVRDDASSDETPRIVTEYADAYPGVVRAVLEPVNRWAEVKPLGALQPLAAGEFIALCEGDDYWIDDTRLERQVNALRKQPDAVLIYHDALSVRGEQVVRESKLMPGAESGMSGRDMLFGLMAPFPTVLYRNVDVVPADVERHVLNYDQFLFVRLGRHGHAVIEPGVGAVHRLHHTSAWFATTKAARDAARAESERRMSAWLTEVGEPEAAAHFARLATTTPARPSRAQVLAHRVAKAARIR